MSMAHVTAIINDKETKLICRKGEVKFLLMVAKTILGVTEIVGVQDSTPVRQYWKWVSEDGKQSFDYAQNTDSNEKMLNGIKQVLEGSCNIKVDRFTKDGVIYTRTNPIPGFTQRGLF